MNNTWTTKDGVTLKVSEMETSHIKNCIAMLKRAMPDFEYDDVICGDHWSIGCMTIPGAETYKRKIKMFEDELLTRI